MLKIDIYIYHVKENLTLISLSLPPPSPLFPLSPPFFPLSASLSLSLSLKYELSIFTSTVLEQAPVAHQLQQ